MFKKQWIVLYFVGVIALGFVGAQRVNAAAFDTLTISPLRTDVEVKPGTSKTIHVTITNPSKRQVHLQAIQNDFVANDENGTPDIILDPNSSAPSHGLKSFFMPIQPFVVEAKSSKTVDVTIAVPENTMAGGYFGAVRFIVDREGVNGQVNLNASLASIILLRVPGDLVEKLSLTDLAVHNSGETLSSLFYMGNKDIELTPRFENSGNIQVSPFGKISIKRGSEMVYSVDFNSKQPRDMILPGGARKWNIPLENVRTFGKYTVYATIAYGETNKTLNLETSFWVVPWKVIIGAGIGVIIGIALLVTIVSVIRFRRRPKRVRLGGHKNKKRRKRR